MKPETALPERLVRQRIFDFQTGSADLFKRCTGILDLQFKTHACAAEALGTGWCGGMIGRHEGDGCGLVFRQKQAKPGAIERTDEAEVPDPEIAAGFLSWRDDNRIAVHESHFLHPVILRVTALNRDTKDIGKALLSGERIGISSQLRTYSRDFPINYRMTDSF